MIMYLSSHHLVLILFISNSWITEAVDCPSGEEVDGETGACRKCRVGYFRTAGVHDSCQKCAGPLITSKQGATSQSDCNTSIGNKGTCPSGTEWVSTKERCETCSEGTYREKGIDYWCVDCPGGTHTRAKGATSVDECIDPCPVGAEWDQVLSHCSPCALNSYRSRGMWSCQACPAGHVTIRTGASSIDDCLARPNSASQLFSNGDCPSGTEWISVLGICRVCSADTYREAGVDTSCQSCPADRGTAGEGTVSGLLCLDKDMVEKIRAMAAPDVICPLGSEWNPYEEACMPCRKGFYRESLARGVCKKCENLQTTSGTGSTSPTFCDPSSNITDLNQFASGACPAGTEWNDNLSGCRVCSKGYHRSSKTTSCSPCPASLTTKAIGAASSADCIIPTVSINGESVNAFDSGDCPAGSEWNSVVSACIPCDRGFYKNDSMQHLPCQQCPYPLTSFERGAKNISLCNVPLVGPDVLPIDIINGCEPGYQPNNPRTECTVCQKGTFKKLRDFGNCGYCPFNSSGEPSETRYKGTTDVTDCLQEAAIGGLRPGSGSVGGGYTLRVLFSPQGFSERVINIFVGGEKCKLHFYSITNGHVNCTLSPSYIPGSRPVTVLLADRRTLSTVEQFLYHLDPVIKSLSRGKVFASGGNNVTIKGTDFRSGTTYLSITNFGAKGERRVVNSVCHVENSTIIQCPVPDMTPWFTQESRRRRDVATSTHLKGYVGLVLDGSDYYRNVTEVIPEYGPIRIYGDPDISPLSQNEYIIFPDLDLPITFQGHALNHGAELSDYKIKIGDHQCEPYNLTQDTLTCVLKAEITSNITMGDPYSTSVKVGRSNFQLSALTFSEGSLTTPAGVGPNVTPASGAANPPGDNGQGGAPSTGSTDQPNKESSTKKGASGPGGAVPSTGSSGDGTGGAAGPPSPNNSGPDGTPAPNTPSAPGVPSGSTGIVKPGDGQEGSPSGPAGGSGASGPGSNAGAPILTGSTLSPGDKSGSKGGIDGGGQTGNSTSGTPGSGDSDGQEGGPGGAGSEGTGNNSPSGDYPGSNGGTPGGQLPNGEDGTSNGGKGDTGGGGTGDKAGASGGNTVGGTVPGSPEKINTDIDRSGIFPSEESDPDKDVIDDNSDIVSILVPILVVLCVVVALIVVVAVLYCHRRKEQRYAQGSLSKSTVSTISDPSLPADGYLPPLPVDSVFGPERVTDKGVKQRQITLPEDGSLSTSIDRKSKLSSDSYRYSTHSTVKI